MMLNDRFIGYLSNGKGEYVVAKGDKLLLTPLAKSPFLFDKRYNLISLYDDVKKSSSNKFWDIWDIGAPALQLHSFAKDSVNQQFQFDFLNDQHNAIAIYFQQIPLDSKTFTFMDHSESPDVFRFEALTRRHAIDKHLNPISLNPNDFFAQNSKIPIKTDAQLRLVSYNVQEFKNLAFGNLGFDYNKK